MPMMLVPETTFTVPGTSGTSLVLALGRDLAPAMSLSVPGTVPGARHRRARGPAMPGPSEFGRAASALAEGLHHPAHAAHVGGTATSGGLLRRLGHDGLGGEDVLADRRRVLERRAGDHGRVDDARLDQVDGLARVDVQAVALRGQAHGVHHDGALEAGVG